MTSSSSTGRTHLREWRDFLRISRQIATHIGFVPQEGKVCELFIDSDNHRGESLSNSHKISLYVGAGQVAKLKHNYESRRQDQPVAAGEAKRTPYDAHFIEWTGQVIELTEPVSRICTDFDVVMTLRNLSCSMRTESEMRRMVEWISMHLKPGGTWIGCMADSSAIWKLLNKTPVTSLFYRDKNFSIEVDAGEIKHYGTGFKFTAPDGTTSQEYLVHVPSLLRTARSFDLHLLEFTSINDLYAEHSKAFKLSPNMEPPHPLWVPLSLFGVFAFEKLEPEASSQR